MTALSHWTMMRKVMSSSITSNSTIMIIYFLLRIIVLLHIAFIVDSLLPCPFFHVPFYHDPYSIPPSTKSHSTTSLSTTHLLLLYFLSALFLYIFLFYIQLFNWPYLLPAFFHNYFLSEKEAKQSIMPLPIHIQQASAAKCVGLVVRVT